MSTYSVGTLLQLWKQNEITTEQAMGYAIQHLVALTERQTELEKRCRRLEQNNPEPMRTPQA
jgi:hypothetical protein